MLCRRVRVNLERISNGKSEDFSGGGCLSLNLGVTLAAPRKQIPTNPQQRCGVLTNHSQWSESTRGDEVLRPQSALPGFRAIAHDGHVVELEQPSGALDEVAFTSVGFDQPHRCSRERDRKREPRQASAGPKVCDHRCGANLRQLQGDQGIGEMIGQHQRRVTDRRGRQRVIDK